MDNWKKNTAGITLILGAALLVVFLIWIVFTFPQLQFLPDSLVAIGLGVGVGFIYVYLDPEGDLNDIVFFDP